MTPGLDLADRPARVLIVDDERQNRDLLEVMLAPEGDLFELIDRQLGAAHVPVSRATLSQRTG